MDLKETAEVLWTEILTALKQDGLIAQCINDTGPNCTKLVLRLAVENMMKETKPIWIPVSMPPPESVDEVYTRNFDRPELPGEMLKYDSGFWRTRQGFLAAPFTHYFVLPGLGERP